MMHYPDILTLIPHRPPFVMIDHIIEITRDAIIVEKTFHDNDYGTRGHLILEGVLIEVAAQAVAAKQGYEDLNCPGKPKRGMLVSVSHTDFFSRAKINVPLRIFAEKKNQVGDFSILAISITQEDTPVAEGTIQIFLEPDV